MNVIETDDPEICPDNTFGCETNSNCKNELNETNNFNCESIGSNHNKLIELNHDGESSNKSLRFDDKSNGSVPSNESIDANTRFAHHFSWQKGISDPVSTITTGVKNEIQLKESAHIQHLFINGHISKATKIETERDVTTFDNTIVDENYIPVFTVCGHDGENGSKCGDDGDIVSNGDYVLDLLCCTCNVDDDSSLDKASDDVNTIDNDTNSEDV